MPCCMSADLRQAPPRVRPTEAIANGWLQTYHVGPPTPARSDSTESSRLHCAACRHAETIASSAWSEAERALPQTEHLIATVESCLICFALAVTRSIWHERRILSRSCSFCDRRAIAKGPKMTVKARPATKTCNREIKTIANSDHR